MKVNLWVGMAIALIVGGMVLPSYGQVLPRRQTGGQVNPPGVGAPAAPAPGEAPGQTRREGRQEAREARAENREAGAPGPAARQAARDTRQATRQNIQATRAADFGVWFNTGARGGLVIDDLSNNGIFATAGFRAGDQIVSINGQPVTSEAQFVQFLTGPNIGTQPIEIVVIRNGQQQTLILQPTALTQGIVTYDPFYQYGIVIDDSRPNQFVVQRVYPRTPAYYAGLRVGDVITTIGGQRITSMDTFSQSLSQAQGQVALGVQRSGQTRDIQLDAIDRDEGAVRTAQRPDFDTETGARTRVDGGARTETRGDATLDRREAPAREPRDRDAAAPPDSAAPRAGTAPREGAAPREGDAPREGAAPRAGDAPRPGAAAPQGGRDAAAPRPGRDAGAPQPGRGDAAPAPAPGAGKAGPQNNPPAAPGKGQPKQ